MFPRRWVVPAVLSDDPLISLDKEDMLGTQVDVGKTQVCKRMWVVLGVGGVWVVVPAVLSDDPLISLDKEDMFGLRWI